MPSHRIQRFRGLFLALLIFAWNRHTEVAGEPVRFSREILPILSDYCFQCHGPDEHSRKAELRLDTEEGARRKNREGRAAVVPGQSNQSLLMQHVLSTSPDEVMPPPKAKHPLRSDQIQLLKRWIDEGAIWGRHWAFEQPARPALPEVKNRSWPRNALDFFVLSRLEREGWQPAPEESSSRLQRRLFLDLTGLPPSEADVTLNAQESSPKTYHALIDHLIASPHFGERMSWDWLEAARYADSNGYQGDNERTMWPWRDWVVQAFNRNLPFDQFTLWQLAGDLLPHPTGEQRLATGFLRNHMINGEGGRIPEENRIDYGMDMTETTATVWLGLTFNCCRCHDHKFDPLSQRDYYSLFAFFNQTPVDGAGGNPQTPPVLEQPSPEQRQRSETLQQRWKELLQMQTKAEADKFPRKAGESIKSHPGFETLPKEIQEALSLAPEKRDAGQLAKIAAHWKTNDVGFSRQVEILQKAVAEKADHARTIPRVMVMEDRREPRETYVLSKGLYDRPAQRVGMAVPSSLPPLPPGSPTNRLGLAQWIVSDQNPLTARVIVNRLWQQFFGIGLVKTAEDFGIQGERPEHAQLLDWLAMEFIESGWNVKHLCRIIVDSATYRQSSQAAPGSYERDPQNRLLSRGPRFRMPSWMIRDYALASSGLLELRTGGRPVNPYQPPGVWEEATFGAKKYKPDTGEALYRRSLYTFWRRIVAPTLFFDTASRQVCTVKQPRTNTPLQALTTLNDVTFVEAARALAERIIKESGPDPTRRIQAAFRRILGRVPTNAEADILLKAVTRHQTELPRDPTAAERLLSLGESKRDLSLPAVDHATWTLVCSTLLNLDEALTKE
ncbi:MAG: DUF1553 domain-containing protein [Verrucomicrobiales bacterium]|nr:DUF1553 domain-containing protein [Verrucomicrobiales bacterium]